MAFKLLFLMLCFFHCELFSYDISSERNNRFIVKVAVRFSDEVKQLLDSQGFKLLYQITSETFVVQFSGKDDGTELMENIVRFSKNKIVGWEPVGVYTNTTIPDYVESKDRSQARQNLVCSHYLGVDVEDVLKNGYTGENIKTAVTDVGINIDPLDFTNNVEKLVGSAYGTGLADAWKAGYTGRNITVAVTDVGINTDHLDLNVDISLSYNFVQDNHDVSPAYPDPTSCNYAEHGNMVASIMACIAHDATIAAIKIFEVNSNHSDSGKSETQHLTAEEILSIALVHRLNDIDIFVNAWPPEYYFDSLELSTLKAIERGATTGRRGLGRIYVVPSGTPGNALSNSIYTVTVGGVGQNGTLMPDVNCFVDASVLVSAPAEGENLTSAGMDHCISFFSGLSAAVAQMGGIIALGLQANEALTLRDVQHLLVLSSEHHRLIEADNFKPNGAGYYYHDFLGFGLINVAKFVWLSKVYVQSQELLKKQFYVRNHNTQSSKLTEVEFCYQCQDLTNDSCITSVEHVSAYIALAVNTDDLQITILSPRGTRSTILKKDTLISEVKGNFVSTHFWYELPTGTWKVIIQRKHIQDPLQMLSIHLTLYGTHVEGKERVEHLNVCAKPALDSNLGPKGVVYISNNVDNSSNLTVINVLKGVCIFFGITACVVLFLIFVLCFLGTTVSTPVLRTSRKDTISSSSKT